MTLHKWIYDKMIHGFPTFSVENARAAEVCSNEQILQNELSRLTKNKTITNVYRGFYVIFPAQYVLRGAIPATYYIDQLMNYLGKPYYVCMLSAAEQFGAAHQRPQTFSVMTTLPKRISKSQRNTMVEWLYREDMPTDCFVIKNTETGTMRISNPLLTAADLVQYQQHVGGLSQVATVLEELAEQLDIRKHFPKVAPFVKNVVWQRLGYILETILQESQLADELYNQLKSLPRKLNYTALSTTAKTLSYSKDTRWKININEDIEPDTL